MPAAKGKSTAYSRRWSNGASVRWSRAPIHSCSADDGLTEAYRRAGNYAARILRLACGNCGQHLGKHDDQVDALGLVGQLLDKWAPGGVPKIDFSPPPTDCL